MATHMHELKSCCVHNNYTAEKKEIGILPKQVGLDKTHCCYVHRPIVSRNPTI